jgi:hypothetical protein
MRRPALIAALCLVLLGAELLAPRSAAAEAVWPRSPRREYDSAGPTRLERRTFVLGGLGLWTDPSSLFATAWGVGGGVILPVNSWAVVPRLDVEGGGESNSSAWMARATLGGRIPTVEFNGRHTFLEGGLGVAFCERRGPFAYTAPGFAASPSPVTSVVTPCLALTSGLTSDPLETPLFVLETNVVLTSHRDGASVFMIRMGLGF